MKRAFVKTENYRKFTGGIEAVNRRGAREAGMMLVFGQPGYGKSHIVSSWAASSGAIFLRANQDWSPKYFLTELCRELNLDFSGTSRQLFERALSVLIERQCPLIIDEAEFTLRDRAAVLEKIRDFSDRAEMTVVLIGMEAIQRSISRYKQISSRIAQVVEFRPCTLADVELACKQLCDFSIAPDLCAEVLRLSSGRMREILNILASIERLAADNNLNAVLTAGHFRGMPLAFDWQSRTEKKVRSGAA